MLQFTNISGSILYKLEKAHNQVLEMINACVSHEMRNPLNSIVAQNIEKEYLYSDLEEVLKYYKLTIKEDAMTTNQKRFFKKCDDIISKLKSGLRVQRSSGNVLTFIVQDLLDYAQMRSGKFRKNIQEFNIKDAVEDVMLIQARKAQDNNIKLYATYNIADGTIMKTDAQRVMQVLLCLQSNALKFTKDGEVEIIVNIQK